MPRKRAVAHWLKWYVVIAVAVSAIVLLAWTNYLPWRKDKVDPHALVFHNTLCVLVGIGMLPLLPQFANRYAAQRDVRNEQCSRYSS